MINLFDKKRKRREDKLEGVEQVLSKLDIKKDYQINTEHSDNVILKRGEYKSLEGKVENINQETYTIIKECGENTFLYEDLVNNIQSLKIHRSKTLETLRIGDKFIIGDKRYTIIDIKEGSYSIEIDRKNKELADIKKSECVTVGVYSLNGGDKLEFGLKLIHSNLYYPITINTNSIDYITVSTGLMLDNVKDNLTKNIKTGIKYIMEEIKNEKLDVKSEGVYIYPTENVIIYNNFCLLPKNDKIFRIIFESPQIYKTKCVEEFVLSKNDYENMMTDKDQYKIVDKVDKIYDVKFITLNSQEIVKSFFEKELFFKDALLQNGNYAQIVSFSDDSVKIIELDSKTNIYKENVVNKSEIKEYLNENIVKRRNINKENELVADENEDVFGKENDEVENEEHKYYGGEEDVEDEEHKYYGGEENVENNGAEGSDYKGSYKDFEQSYVIHEKISKEENQILQDLKRIVNIFELQFTSRMYDLVKTVEQLRNRLNTVNDKFITVAVLIIFLQRNQGEINSPVYSTKTYSRFLVNSKYINQKDIDKTDFNQDVKDLKTLEEKVDFILTEYIEKTKHTLNLPDVDFKIGFDIISHLKYGIPQFSKREVDINWGSGVFKESFETIVSKIPDTWIKDNIQRGPYAIEDAKRISKDAEYSKYYKMIIDIYMYLINKDSRKAKKTKT